MEPEKTTKEKLNKEAVDSSIESHEDNPLSITNPNPVPPITPKNYTRTLMAMMLLIILILIAILSYSITSNKNSQPTKTTTTSSVNALAPAQVSITKNGFVPATIKVRVNQGIIWTNNDTAQHQVSSDPYPTDNGLADFNQAQPMTQNQSWDFIFNKVGTFSYHDNLNPYSIKGTVIVTK